MNELGRFIKEKREQKGISLRSMAKDINISSSYLSDIETGNKPVLTDGKIELFNIISDYLKLDESDINRFNELCELDYNQRGKLTKETTEYINEVPLASIALRTAKEKSLKDEDWKKIIEEMNK